MNKRKFFNGKRIASFVFSIRCIQWMVLAVILLALLFLVPMQSRVSAVATCATSGPPAGAYTVTVCITSPSSQSTLIGIGTVTASTSLTPAPAPGAANPVQKLIYTLDGSYLLTDFQTPYSFLLPSTQWVDGSHQLSVQAVLRDGFISSSVSIPIIFRNGIATTPPPPTNFSIRHGTTPPNPGDPLIVAATGDGASGEANAGNVVNLISSWNPNLFLYLGDVYDAGSKTEFYNWYGHGASFYDKFRAITNPTVGNHEYYNNNGQAPGYMNYWGSPPHYYSFNVHGWHFISIDSNLENAPTGAGSPVYQWLKNDLATDNTACTLAYWHIPLYNVGKEPAGVNMKDIWALLVQNKADLVLTGHDHDYQRWVPLNASGLPASNGVTQFVVGTGGHGIQTFVTSDTRLAAGFDSTTSPMPFGALRLKLYATQAVYEYITIAGTVLDSGTIACKNAAHPSNGPIQSIFLPMIER